MCGATLSACTRIGCFRLRLLEYGNASGEHIATKTEMHVQRQTDVRRSLVMGDKLSCVLCTFVVFAAN